MTKNVRIENADNGTHFGVVLTKTEDLDYPAMLSTVLLHSGVFFVIREKTLDIIRSP